MHENTIFFSFSPFFEIFRGAFAHLAPPPHGAAPVWDGILVIVVLVYPNLKSQPILLLGQTLAIFIFILIKKQTNKQTSDWELFKKLWIS